MNKINEILESHNTFLYSCSTFDHENHLNQETWKKILSIIKSEIMKQGTPAYMVYDTTSTEKLYGEKEISKVFSDFGLEEGI